MGSKNHQVKISSIKFPKTKAKQSGQLSITAEKALSLYLAELNLQLIDMLSNADDHLFDKSGKSDDSRHFAALRTLRVKKEGLANQFKQEIIYHFKQTIGQFDQLHFSDGIFKASAEIESLSFENLSLVDDEDLEEQIAIDTMVSRARKDNIESLEYIRRRLDVLLPSKVISEALNPFDPSFVCSAFSSALKPIQLEVEFKLVLYKFFERNVIQELEFLYQQINDFFIAQGILPELKTSPIKRKPIRGSKEDSQRVSDEALNENKDTQEILSVISELLALKRGNVDVVAQPIETNLLINALSNIQISDPLNITNSTDQNAPCLQDVRGLLVNQLPRPEDGLRVKGAFGQFNEDMIDVVTMLFDFILDDDNLHSEVKAIISRLQIPILKVGLIDRTFLSNRKHSARLLLNELAHAGLTCEPADPGSELMLNRIRLVVEKINCDFTDDVQVFDQLLASFLGFKSEHHKRASIFERRTREAEEGKAKAEGARGRVNNELKKICFKKHVPEVVKQLLKQVWVPVMFLESLKADEAAWQIVCQLAKLMVWSVQPVKDQARLDKLTRTVPILIKNLKLGFSKISFSEIESSGLLDRLEDTHRQIIKQARTFIEEDNKETIIRLMPKPAYLDPLDEVVEFKPEQVAKEISETEIQPFIIEEIAFSKEETGQSKTSLLKVEVSDDSRRIIESLHAGSWFELNTDNVFKRCKLAARIVSSGKYIFVNRSGVKVAEYLTEELAAEYQLGNLKILDDDALFDRALESVISNLRAMKSAAD